MKSKVSTQNVPNATVNARIAYIFTDNQSDSGQNDSSYNGLSHHHLQLAQESDAELFVICATSKDATRIGKQFTLHQQDSPQALVYSDLKNISFLKKAISGNDPAKSKPSAVVLNRSAIERLTTATTSIETLNEVVYLLSKEIISTQLHYGTQEIKQKTSFIDTRKSGFLNFYEYFFGKHKNIAKLAFIFSVIIGMFFITSTSQQAGISGDEFVQHEYGKVIASYHLEKIGIDLPIDTMDLKGQKMNTIAKSYAEKGPEIALLEDPDRLMHLYGSSFDTFCALCIHVFGIEDYMEFRHLINSLFGWLIFLYGALIVRRLTGGSWIWASVAFIVLFFTPRIFGEALNNPKDIPFALGYVMSLYYAMKVFHKFPTYRVWDVIGLAFGIALGISIRIGGLLTIAIIGVYLLLKYIQEIGFKSFIGFKWSNWKSWLLTFTLVSVIAYIIGIYVWPYGWDKPIDNPLKALSAFTDYEVSLRQLFQGVLYDSDNLPPHYLVHYIWITLPVGVLGGLLLYIIGSAIHFRKFTAEEFLLLFSAVFPIFYIWFKDSSVYGGLRHIIFTLPGFIMLAVIGFRKIQEFMPNGNKIAPILALVPTLLPAKFVLQNQNLSYIYFNETIGGIDGAYGNYELDYYLASLKPSSDYLAENVLSTNPNKNFKIVSYGMDQVKYYLRKYPNAQVGFTRFDDRSDKQWDYAVFYNAYMDQYRLKNGYYPPVGTVFRPEVNGKPVGCVVQRRSEKDFQGIQALNKENNPYKAISLLKEHVKTDSTSSESWFYLANAYATLQNLDSAILMAEKSLQVFKENSRALFLLYQVYMNQNSPKKAIEMMDNYIVSRPKDPDGYIMKGQAQLMLKDYYGGIESVQKAIPLNPFDDRIYRIGAQAYQLLNDNTNATLWYSAAMFKQARTQQEQSAAIQNIQRLYLDVTGEELELEKYFR